MFHSHFAGGPCDSEWESYNNRCYLFVNSRATFNIATLICQGQDATLVSVADEEEKQFYHVRNYSYYSFCNCAIMAGKYQLNFDLLPLNLYVNFSSIPILIHI